MSFGLGDRVRWATTDEDGLPVVRYGFVGGAAGDGGPVVVMLDGELAGEVIDLEQLEPVSITNVELHLDGPDLIDDPNLRRGLVHLWQAEAEMRRPRRRRPRGPRSGRAPSRQQLDARRARPAAASSTSCGPPGCSTNPTVVCIRAEPFRF